MEKRVLLSRCNICKTKLGRYLVRGKSQVRRYLKMKTHRTCDEKSLIYALNSVFILADRMTLRFIIRNLSV